MSIEQVRQYHHMFAGQLCLLRDLTATPSKSAAFEVPEKSNDALKLETATSGLGKYFGYSLR